MLNHYQGKMEWDIENEEQRGWMGLGFEMKDIIGSGISYIP